MGRSRRAERGRWSEVVKKVTIRSIPGQHLEGSCASRNGELSAADGLTPDDVPTVKQSGLKVGSATAHDRLPGGERPEGAPQRHQRAADLNMAMGWTRSSRPSSQTPG